MRTTIHKYITMNRSNKPLKAIGVVLHETASPGGTAEAHFKYFNTADRHASAHAFVDWTETLCTIPWTEKAGHACEPANSKFIGVEMCHPKGHNLEQFTIVYQETVFLFARIFYNILKIKTVTKENCMSHHEVSLKWKKSTHVDPTSFFKEYEKTMDGFRKDVQEELDKLNKVL